MRAARDGGVAQQLAVVLADRGDPGPAGADGGAVGDDVVGPAARDEQGGLGGAREAGDEQRRAVAVRAGHGDVAGVGVGRAGLGERVVAVVPDRDQARVDDRGERGGAGADDDAHLPARHGQPAPVALGGPEVGGEGDDGVRARHGLAGGLDAVEVAAVGHHEHRAPPGRGRGGGGLGETGGPVLARQGLPDGVRGPVRREGLEERRPPGVGAPAVLLRCLRVRPLRRRLRLDPRVTRRHREAQDVGERPGVAVGDGPAEAGELGAQDRFRGDDLLQPPQAAGVLAGVLPREHEAVDQPAGEPHPHPRAGDRLVGELLGHLVVERPVEVREVDVHGHLGHRALGGGQALVAQGLAGLLLGFGARARAGARARRTARRPPHPPSRPHVYQTLPTGLAGFVSLGAMLAFDVSKSPTSTGEPSRRPPRG